MLQKLLGLLSGKLATNTVGAAASGIGAYLTLMSSTGQPITKAGLGLAAATAIGANVVGLFQEKPRATQATRVEDGYDPDAVAKALERAKVQTQLATESKPTPQTPGSFGR